MTKYQMMSLQVSNAGGFEQATALISLLTMHSTVMKQQRPCFVSFKLKLYFYEEFFIMKDTTDSLRNCGCNI